MTVKPNAFPEVKAIPARTFPLSSIWICANRTLLPCRIGRKKLRLSGGLYSLGNVNTELKADIFALNVITNERVITFPFLITLLHDSNVPLVELNADDVLLFCHSYDSGPGNM